MDSVQRYRDRRLSRMKDNWSRYDSVEEYQARKWLRYWHLDAKFTPKDVKRWGTKVINGKVIRYPIFEKSSKASEKLLEHETGSNATGKPASVPKMVDRGEERKKAVEQKRKEKALGRIGGNTRLSDAQKEILRKFENGSLPLTYDKKHQDLHSYENRGNGRSYFDSSVKGEDLYDWVMERRWGGGNLTVFETPRDRTYAIEEFDYPKKIATTVSETTGKPTGRTGRLKVFYGVDGVHITPRFDFRGD